MICAVCSAQAPHRCASCSSVAYCSAEHQKEHWKIHQKNCPYFKIVEDPKLGKGFVATRNIKPRTIILEELPVAFAPDGRFDCLTCGLIGSPMRKIFTGVRRCSRCNWPVCSLECEKHPFHSENECQVFASQNFESIPDCLSYVVFRDIVMVIRVCMLKRKDPAMYQHVLDLCSEYKLSNVKTKTSLVVSALKVLLDGFGGLEITPAEVAKLVKIFRINCITNWRSEQQIDSDPNGYVISTSLLYLKSSRMNHSCIPNCERDLGVKPEFKIRFRTTRAVKKGEALTHFYFHENCIAEATHVRQKSIRKDWLFKCECDRCKDPTELGTYISGVICESCRYRGMTTSTSGYFLPVNPLNLSAGAKWKCNCCGLVKLATNVLQRVEKFDQKIFKMERKFFRKPHSDRLLVFCKEFVNKTSGIILHPNHWLIQNVMALACRYLLFCRRDSMGLVWSEFFIKSSKHTLAILDLITPGLTRRRAATHWSLGITLHLQVIQLLFFNKYQQIEINLEESLENLKEALKYYTDEFHTEDDVSRSSDTLKQMLFEYSKDLIYFQLNRLKVSGLKK